MHNDETTVREIWELAEAEPGERIETGVVGLYIDSTQDGRLYVLDDSTSLREAIDPDATEDDGALTVSEVEAMARRFWPEDFED